MKRLMYSMVAVASAVLFAYTQYLIFYGTPLEPNVALLFNQKIFYYHVPCAFVLFISVFVCGIASVFYLVKRQARYDDVAQAAGALAVVFGIAMLATGSIWGRASWGRWWVWDPRLTTSLLLCMMMFGYALVRKYGGPGFVRLAAGLAVFAMANVPLVYFSVKFKDRQHPEATVVSTLDPSMRAAFWLSITAFILLYLVFLIARIGQARLKRRIDEIHERALDAGFSL